MKANVHLYDKGTHGNVRLAISGNPLGIFPETGVHAEPKVAEGNPFQINGPGPRK